MNRGDVILVRFPHPSGVRGKKRPAVIVQSDVYPGAVSTARRGRGHDEFDDGRRSGLSVYRREHARWKGHGAWSAFCRLLSAARERVRGHGCTGVGFIVTKHEANT